MLTEFKNQIARLEAAIDADGRFRRTSMSMPYFMVDECGISVTIKVKLVGKNRKEHEISAMRVGDAVAQTPAEAVDGLIAQLDSWYIALSS